MAPGAHTIGDAASSVTAFVAGGLAGPNRVEVRSMAEFHQQFGNPGSPTALGLMIQDFFANGGRHAVIAPDLHSLGAFNVMCLVPGAKDPVNGAIALCESRRAMLILDPPAAWSSTADALRLAPGAAPQSANVALYFPRIGPREPSGAIAGVIARTDANRGVWAAPAGFSAALTGVPPLSLMLTDPEVAALTRAGINALRELPGVGSLVWGARTRSADSEYKYIPVRRLALFIEESVYQGTEWVVFEPNGEPLWMRVRGAVTAFLHRQFQRGAFRGAVPKDGYFVRCDQSTHTQSDIDQGNLNIVIGFAPLRPAEFVELRLRRVVQSRQG
ncbi:MAG: phage tail sheath family protein [Acidobacteria bacterium]|nr:phage tail sheath family protein [Acidobacteriota bacterium]